MNPEVGKAYRGRDGLVRWVIHRTSKGAFQTLWLEEKEGIWFNGASVKPQEWDFCAEQGEVEPPQPGEHYLRMGPLGHLGRWVAGEPGFLGRRIATKAYNSDWIEVTG